MNPCFASTMNFSYGDQFLVYASEYMNMVNELAMLRREKAALTDSNQNKDEIILSLKNDSSCLLKNHIRVMVEKREVVREKNKLKEELDEVKCQLEEKILENEKVKDEVVREKKVLEEVKCNLEEKVEENKKVKKELLTARAQYEEQKKKTDELLTNAEQHVKEQVKNAELIKNAQVELEKKEHLLQLKESEIEDEKFWAGRHSKENRDLYHELSHAKDANKKLFEENITFGKELGRMKKAGCWKRLLKRW